MFVLFQICNGTSNMFNRVIYGMLFFSAEVQWVMLQILADMRNI